MKRIWSFVALLVIVFPILVACGGGEKPTATKEEVKPTATAEEIAEVNIEAKADILRDWVGYANGKAYSEPIGVALNFTGGMAAKAYRYGQVQITAAKHNKGLGGDLEIIWIRSSRGVFWADLSEFQVIDHAKVDFFTEELVQPEDGFRVHIQFFPIEGVTQITTLTGMVTLQTIDWAQVIAIENLDSLRSTSETQLEDPKFDAIGNVSVEFDDNVTLVVEGQVLDDLKARIVDAQGNILLPTSRGSSTVGGTETKDLGFSIPDEDLPGARLEIIPFFKAQVITIENLDSLRSTSETQLKDPKFDAIGNVSVEFDDYVTLIVKGQALPDDLEARIIDAQGNIWLSIGWGSVKVGRTETKD